MDAIIANASCSQRRFSSTDCPCSERGCWQRGIRCVASHFCGHGATRSPSPAAMRSRPARVSIVTMLLMRNGKQSRGANGCSALRCFEMQLGLLVRLLRSLASVRTTVPIQTLVDPHTPAVASLLEGLGIAILPLPTGPLAPAWASPYHAPTFAKLRLLRLHQFEKVLFLDNDVNASRNLDELLLHGPTPAMVFQVLAQGLNSGVMLLAPDASLADRADALMRATRNRTRDGGDQEVWELLWASTRTVVYELPLAFNTRPFIRLTRGAASGVLAYHSVDRDAAHALAPMVADADASARARGAVVSDAPLLQSRQALDSVYHYFA